MTFEPTYGKITEDNREVNHLIQGQDMVRLAKAQTLQWLGHVVRRVDIFTPKTILKVTYSLYLSPCPQHCFTSLYVNVNLSLNVLTLCTRKSKIQFIGPHMSLSSFKTVAEVTGTAKVHCTYWYIVFTYSKRVDSKIQISVSQTFFGSFMLCLSLIHIQMCIRDRCFLN